MNVIFSAQALGASWHLGRSALVAALGVAMLAPSSGQSQTPQSQRGASASQPLPLAIGIEKLADIGCNGQLSFFKRKADREIAHPDALERRFGQHVVYLWDSGKMIARVEVKREGLPPELKLFFEAQKDDLVRAFGEPELSGTSLLYSVEGGSLIFELRNGRVDDITWQCAD